MNDRRSLVFAGLSHTLWLAMSSRAAIGLAAVLVVAWSGASSATNLPGDRAMPPASAIEKAHWGHSNCLRGPYPTPWSRRSLTGWHRHEGSRIGIRCERKADFKRNPTKKRRPIDPRAGGPQPDPPGRR
jgi:hypothetical protein